ncbi:hypothetical protein Barb4_03280 [Bacteroidales bacterium Barb4]|nr:hypothetical protein Barb4_03280 [Bacteroidales bacterium Barb4]
MRPLPVSWLASSPSVGSITVLPKDRRRSKFCCTAGWANISKSIAGAMKTGALQER